MNGSFIPAKDGYWLVIQNTSRVSLFCFCSHEFFPTFSSFSRQTDIHGCSWSIGIALGISEHWQLQVHCYFLSTERPRMTTFVTLCSRDKGSGLLMSIDVYCQVGRVTFWWHKKKRNCFLQRLKFPQSRSAANHRDTMTWTQRQNAQSMLRQFQNVSNPFAKLTTSLTPFDSCIWRKSALLFHKILLRRWPATWDWRRPGLNVLKIAEHWYEHGLMHSRSSTIPGNHGTFWHAKDTCCDDFAGVHLCDKEGAHVKDYLNQTSGIIKLPIQTNSNHLTPSADLGQSKRTSCTIPWKCEAVSGVSVFSIFRYIWPNVFSWNGKKNHGDPTKTWSGPRITGSSPVLKIWINTIQYISIPWY